MTMTPTERDALWACLHLLEQARSQETPQKPNHPALRPVERILNILAKRPSKRAHWEKEALRNFSDANLPNATGPLWG